MNAGWIGGIAGAVIGMIGGIVGTYFSIKNTNGPLERALVVKFCILGWIAVVLFLGLMMVLSSPYRYFLWLPYSILLPFGIRSWNREQQKIREVESQGQGVKARR